MAEVKDPSRESSETSSSPVPVAGTEEPKDVSILNTTDEDEKKATPAPGPPDLEYPGVITGSVLTIALLLAMFLVALDMVRTMFFRYLCEEVANQVSPRASSPLLSPLSRLTSIAKIRWMVRICLLPLLGQLSGLLGKSIQVLPHQDCLSNRHRRV